MNCHYLKCASIAFATLATTTIALGDVWVPTNYGIGADAEVREFQPVNNFGASTEIASRIRNDFIAGNPNDSSDRNSAIYIKIDLTDYFMPASGNTAFRMTYRNNNLTGPRIQDTITPNPDIRTGMAFYGLTNTALGNWSENTITYLTAPGITFDGDVGTRDFNSDLSFLGTAAFPEIGTQNHLPIGGQLILTSDLLDAFVSSAIANGETSVTIVAATIHGGDAPFSTWLNFNYLFNPKEQLTLNTDNYDAGDGNGDLGNLYGTDNSLGQFSPSLLLAIPSPGTLALLAVAGLAGRRRRRT
jgi:hypothetical protein